MNWPNRFIYRMIGALVVVAAVVLLFFGTIWDAFLANAALNGFILGALLIGIIHVFRSVLSLRTGNAWIERFKQDERAIAIDNPPRVLTPMATMMSNYHGDRFRLSGAGMRTLLDGVASRLDEDREISRYMIGLLVFLGLLGTFWGLLLTVQSIGNVIGNLSVGQSAEIGSAFEDLKTGLQQPLQGMGTAFSSSLFGLAGSLVMGFLALQAGQAQNRFYNNLEEWLSGLTRITSSGVGGGEGEASVPAFIEALLEQTADNIESLQRTLSRSEDSRIEANRQLIELTNKLDTLTETMKAEQNLMLRLAESQMELRPVLSKLADQGQNQALTTHLRSVETYLSRIHDEMGRGRTELMQDIRGEMRLIARTISALPDE